MDQYGDIGARQSMRIHFQRSDDGQWEAGLPIGSCSHHLDRRSQSLKAWTVRSGIRTGERAAFVAMSGHHSPVRSSEVRVRQAQRS